MEAALADAIDVVVEVAEAHEEDVGGVDDLVVLGADPSHVHRRPVDGLQYLSQHLLVGSLAAGHVAPDLVHAVQEDDAPLGFA